MTFLELEAEFAAKFRSQGFDQPGFEARRLLQEAGLNQQSPLTPSDIQKAQQWLASRLGGVPLAYLSGVKGFYKYEFLVEPGVLVPRPESEHVIEVALRRLPRAISKDTHFADLGCGSGCIGLSLLKEWASAKLWAIDQSETACRVSLKNADRLGVSARVQVLNQRVEEWQLIEGPMDLVVANPPYIAQNDPAVQKSVHEHEPHAALYSGPDGLSAIRQWTKWASENLKPGGLFVCEIGTGQSTSVQEIMAQAGFREIEMTNDLAGHDRVMSGIKDGVLNG